MSDDNPKGGGVSRLERSLVYRLVHRLFHIHLTTTGKLLFWIVLLSTSVSLFTFQLKAYILWTGLLSICACSILFSRLARRTFELEIELPDRVRHGQQFRVEILAHNRSKRTARDVRVRYLTPEEISEEGDIPFLCDLKGGESHLFCQLLTPKKRGAYLLKEALQENCFPYGLWQDVKTHVIERSLLVYPKYHPLREFDIPVGMKYQPGGLALTSYLGDSTEFLSTREFRLGDPLRHIHWRSWARLGIPIVKEYGEEYFCRLALIVDTALPLGANENVLEQSISLAAAITDYLSREEYVIDIFAAGPKLYYLQAGRSLAYLQNIMDILSCLEPTPPDDESFQEMESALKEELEGISTTILLFIGWDERRARMVDELQQKGTAVRGFLISDNEETAQRLPENIQWLRPELIEAGLDEL
jgi:uncharacterized protein (DUF58 family)